MKNNKNKQSLVTLWTYKCMWIDVEADLQSQTELGDHKRRWSIRRPRVQSVYAYRTTSMNTSSIM